MSGGWRLGRWSKGGGGDRAGSGESMGRRLGFGRQKRLMLGFLALVAPFPLPFNEALGWGVYLLYAVGVVAFMVRARRGAEGWLPIWAANLLAIAYLPFLGVDLMALSGGSLVGPVIHLGLFAVLVKLWSLRQERDKWHAALGIFFLFVAASATSVHMSVVLYLAVFLGGTLLLLARFALFHLLTGFGHRQPGEVEVPLTAFVVLSVATAVLVAVPLFALLPRVDNPFIGAVGRGISNGSMSVSGFSDDVTLDSIRALRASREVALRLTYEGMPPPTEIRLKGGAFDRLEGGRWQRSERVRQIRSPAPTRVELADPMPEIRGEVGVWLQPLFAKGLPLPVETARLEVPMRAVNLNRGGALSLVARPTQPLQYRAWLAPGPVSTAVSPASVGSGDGGAHPTLETSAVTPRIAELADRVAGEGTVAQRAARLETFLLDNFTYTLDSVRRTGANPLEDFLFEDRRGHCEYFASALVLLLRAEGIHARLATGFLGGDLNPLGYVIVRQSNAHAWVEGWIPGEGWRIFDPTPPAGRPGIGEQSWASMAGQVYDSVVFQWERYVLSYGVEDQASFVYSAFSELWSWMAIWRDDDGGDEAPAVDDFEAAAEPSAGTAPEEESPGWAATASAAALSLLLATVLVLAAYLLWRRHQAGFTATRAYRQLRQHLGHLGLPVTEATAPLELERRAVRRWPAAAEPAGRLVALYLEESFGGRSLGEAEREAAREALRRARRELRVSNHQVSNHQGSDHQASD